MTFGPMHFHDLSSFGVSARVRPPARPLCMCAYVHVSMWECLCASVSYESTLFDSSRRIFALHLNPFFFPISLKSISPKCAWLFRCLFLFMFMFSFCFRIECVGMTVRYRHAANKAQCPFANMSLILSHFAVSMCWIKTKTSSGSNTHACKSTPIDLADSRFILNFLRFSRTFHGAHIRQAPKNMFGHVDLRTVVIHQTKPITFCQDFNYDSDRTTCHLAYCVYLFV